MNADLSSAEELTMKFFGFLTVKIMRILNFGSLANGVTLSVDRYAYNKKPLFTVISSPLRKQRPNKSGLTFLPAIHHILGMGSRSEIFGSIIRRVSVSMVNASKCFKAKENRDNLMHSEFVDLSFYTDFDGYSVKGTVASWISTSGHRTSIHGIPSQPFFPFVEMLFGASFPDQVSRFRNVVEAFDKVLFGYRVTLRHFAGYFSELLRSATALECAGVSVLQERSA